MQRLINILLLVGFCIGYLQWGTGNHSFVIEAEFNILFGQKPSADTFTHPLILLPLAGQILTIVTIFQKIPNRRLSTLALLLMSVLILLLFAIGLLAGNMTMIASTLLFLSAAIWHFWKGLKKGIKTN